MIDVLIDPFSRSPSILGMFAHRAANAPPPTTWDITVVTTGASQDYTVDINAGTGVNIDIDWGDSTLNNYTTTGKKTHTYSVAGTYKVKIKGSFSSNGNIRLGSDPVNRGRVTASGAIPYIPGLTSLSSTFQTLTNLISVPDDLLFYNPNVTSLRYLLSNCFSLSLNIKEGFFSKCTNVTDFLGAIGNVIQFPLPEKLLWPMPLITNMAYAFSSSLPRSGGAIPADFLRKSVNCINFSNIFEGITFTTASYSALLNSLDAYIPTTGWKFHGGNSKYDASAVAARASLVSKGDTITDAGPE